MKKITYFFITAAIALFFVGCAEDNVVVEEQENTTVQKLVFDAEMVDDSDPETRIYYVERPTGTGIDARWKVGDEIEFLLRNTANQAQAVVGRVIGLHPGAGKENVARIETYVSGFNLNIPLTYYSVTGSGIVGTYNSWGSVRRLTKPKYFQGGGNWDNPSANYHLIKTNHVVNDRVVSGVGDITAYNNYLKQSVIQVASGNASNGNYIFLRFRNIGSLFALNINNTTNTDIEIKEITLESATNWVYELNNADNRYDPTPGTNAMTPGSVKSKSYQIFNYTGTTTNRFFNVAAGGTSSHYQWFMPSEGTAVSDLKVKVVFRNGTTKYINLNNVTFAREKRYKITRTWNGSEFVKE